GGAVGDADRVPRAAIGGKAALELLDLGSQDVDAVIDHALDRGHQLGLHAPSAQGQGDVGNVRLCHGFIGSSRRLTALATWTCRCGTDTRPGGSSGAAARTRAETP